MSDNIAGSLLTWDQIKGSEESKLVIGVFYLYSYIANYH